jgi:hypothetical protein
MVAHGALEYDDYKIPRSMYYVIEWRRLTGIATAPDMINLQVISQE